MKNRILSLVLVLCITLALAPVITTTASAHNVNYTLYLDDVSGKLLNGEGGSEVTFSGEAEVSGSAGARTLTFSNFVFETSAATALSVPDNTTIVLSGNNTIKSGDSSTEDSVAIIARGDLTIKGDGELDAIGADATGYDSYGIYIESFSGGSITISSGVINAASGDAITGMRNGHESSGTSRGIYADKDIAISGGTVTATSGFSEYITAGIYMGGTFTISGNTVVSAVGGRAGDFGKHTSYGILAIDLIVTGGTVVARGGDSSGSSSYGIMANNFSAADCTVTASGGTIIPDEINKSIGIDVCYDTRISGNATVGAMGDTYGFDSGLWYMSEILGSLTISGTNAKIVAQGGEAAAYFWYAPPSSIKVIGGASSSDSYTLSSIGDPLSNERNIYRYCYDNGTNDIVALYAEISNVDVPVNPNISLSIKCDGLNTVSNTNANLENSAGSVILSSDRKTISVQAKDGYTIEDVTVDGNSIGAVSSYAFSDTKDHVIVVTFKSSGGTVTNTNITMSIKCDGLNTTSNTNASLENSAGSVTISTNRKTISVQAKDGYATEDVTIDGKSVGAVSSYTFSDTKDHSVVVTFKEIEEKDPNVNNNLPFTDVGTTAWYYDAVSFAYKNKLFSGTSATTFEPNTTMSRAMMAQVLYNLSSKPATNKAQFSDVADGDWFAEAVAWASEKKIVNGYGNGHFGPSDNITREQMATMLYNYCIAMDIEFTVVRGSGSFADAGNISDWAAKAVDAMYKAGILNGKGNNAFDPKGTATRAEVAQLFMNFMEATS